MNSPLFRNQLLQAMAPDDLSRIAGFLTRIPLRPRQLLQVSRTPMERVLFIESGLVSVNAAAGRGKMVEAWLTGCEGMTGLPVLLQDEEPALQRLVQVGGEAWEIGRTELVALMEACPGIRSILMRYVKYVLYSAVQTGICNANHMIEQRLARWLLMARDGLADDKLPVTHRTLGRILGVRRASVTHSLGTLESSGAISVTRGAVLVVEAEQLQQRSCECARYLKREYQRLIAPPPPRGTIRATSEPGRSDPQI